MTDAKRAKRITDKKRKVSPKSRKTRAKRAKTFHEDRQDIFKCVMCGDRASKRRANSSNSDRRLLRSYSYISVYGCFCGNLIRSGFNYIFQRCLCLFTGILHVTNVRIAVQSSITATATEMMATMPTGRFHLASLILESRLLARQCTGDLRSCEQFVRISRHIGANNRETPKYPVFLSFP